jgi:acetoin utilization protein AcuB
MLTSVPVLNYRTGVGEALRLLRENGLPALPVVENSHLMGLVFEKDLLRLAPSEATTLDVYELREALERLNVGRVLRRVPALASAAGLGEALLQMGRASVEAVPVVDEDGFAGLLTWPALLRALGDAMSAE